MLNKTENPATCEMRSVTCFLNAENMTPAEIRRQLCNVYGEHAMSIQWYGDGCDRLMNYAKTCVMISGATDRLW